MVSEDFLVYLENMPTKPLVPGCNINQTDSGRRTALHYAVEVGAVEVVAALLEAGAEADVREKARGRTPLHLATVTNSLEILKLLLKPLLEDPWHARSVLKVADKISSVLDSFIHI
ncbi:ankyrin repeat domain-containing protein 39-like [Penaeus indicus]|uniref:ankyrin repeat domain-containing protein 39-like n=1 Tax=Penaeus indicus TaxID=29960 RepID=UPI00300CD03F